MVCPLCKNDVLAITFFNWRTEDGQVKKDAGCRPCATSKINQSLIEKKLRFEEQTSKSYSISPAHLKDIKARRAVEYEGKDVVLEKNPGLVLTQSPRLRSAMEKNCKLKLAPPTEITRITEKGGLRSAVERNRNRSYSVGK